MPGKAVYKMTEALHTRPQYVMILGPFLSITASATAQVSHFWNLTQVIYPVFTFFLASLVSLGIYRSVS